MTNDDDSRVIDKRKLGLGVWALDKLQIFNFYPYRSYRFYVAVLTFICYASYHMSRKPFSVVASVLAPNCTSIAREEDEESEGALEDEKGWPPFNGTHCKTLIGAVDYTWLFTYAIIMICSGFIADRVNLRYFLTIGMLGSGVFVGLLGVAYFAQIHHIAYFIVVQIFVGVFESTGWPGVVAVMGNWFGKKNRGLFLGIWNAHTSIGNILGTAIPAIWAQPGQPWGWAFLAPALVMIVVGIIIFFFLVTDPAHIGLPPPKHHIDQTNVGVGIDKPPNQSTQSDSHPNGSQQSPCGSPAFNINRKKEKYQTFSFSDQEGETDVNEQIQLIESERGFGDRVTAVEETSRDSDLQSKAENKKMAISIFQAFRVPGVLEYATSLFFAKLVAYTFLFWLPYYITFNPIKGDDSFDRKEADLMATLYDAGGIFGGIITGAMSDFLNARAISSVIMMYLAVPTLFIYRSYGDTSRVASGVLIVFCGLFINGPYALITTAVSNDLGTHKSLQANQKAKATVGAIIDGFGSLGAATGPLVTGWVSDDFGWDNVFYVLMAACFLSSVMLSRLLFGEFKYYYQKLKNIRRRAKPEDQQTLVSNQAEESKL